MKHRIALLSFTLGAALALTACGTSSPATEEGAPPTDPPAVIATTAPQPSATTDTGYDAFQAFAGSWSGSWTNTTFGSTGDLVVMVKFNMDGTATFTFDAGGFIFGAFDPPEVTFNATYNAMGVTIDLPGNAVFGDVMVTVHPDGTFEMVGDLIPAAGIARVEATGTFSETTMEATYTVFFDGEGVGEGTVTMTKTP